jgi:hypothetical protein
MSPMAPGNLSLSPDLFSSPFAATAPGAGSAPAATATPGAGHALEVPGYQSRGDWLDTVVMPRESRGRPNIGWGETDLTPYLAAGKTVYGFPDWPGKPGPAGNSTAAGLYQITKTNWLHYAPLLGVNDFSPESQRKVAEAVLRDQGPRAWAASGPVPGRIGGRFGSLDAAMAPMQLAAAEPVDPTKRMDQVRPAQDLNIGISAPSAGTPFQDMLKRGGGAAIPLVPGPGRGGALQPVPISPAPNLYKGYQDALASILNGQRRGFGSIFG